MQYTFPSVHDGKITFYTNKGHVFYENNMCAESNLFQTKQTRKICVVTRGTEESHDHDKVSRDMLEYEIIFWGCLLRTLNSKEAIDDSVKFVVSTWPHKLFIPNLTKSISERFFGLWLFDLNKILIDFGDDKYQEFRTFLVTFRPTYWSDPVLVGTEGNPC